MQTDERVVRGVFSLLLSILVCGCWTLPTCADEVVLTNDVQLEGRLLVGTQTIVLRVDTPQGTREAREIQLDTVGQLTNVRDLYEDVVVLEDGTQLKGQLVEKDAPTITMEVVGLGGRDFPRLALKDIRSITRGDAKAKKVFGFVNLRAEPPVDSNALADATVQGIRKSLKNDDLTIVVIDGPVLEPADACRIGQEIQLAREEYGNDRLLAHVKNAREAAAVLTLCFSQIVIAPDATLQGYAANAMEQTHRDKLLRCVRSCDPKRTALAEALCSGTSVIHNEDTGWHTESPNVQGDRFGTSQGVLHMSAGDLVSTKTALARGEDHADTHLALGIKTKPKYLKRTIAVRIPKAVAAGQPRPLDGKRIELYNAGLAEAKEGIDAFKENGWWLWGKVEPYWRTRRANLNLMDPDVKDRSGDAQQLMLNGLGDAIRAAEYMQTRLKTMNDPRFEKAETTLKVLEDLESAITPPKQFINFKKKCEAVLELDPI